MIYSGSNLLPGLALLSLLCGLPHAASADFTVAIKSVAADALINSDSLNVQVQVASTFDVREVKARIDTVERILPFGNHCRNSDCFSGFANILPLKGLAKGVKQLKVEVTDVMGDTAGAVVTFRYVDSLRLMVESPVEMEVASPELPIKITCRHDPSATCTLELEFDGGRKITSPKDLDTAVRVQGTVGRSSEFKVRACDTHGQCVAVTRKYLFENSAHLARWKRVDRQIVDYRYGQILYADVLREKGPSYDLTTLTDAKVLDTQDSVVRTAGETVAERLYAVALTPSRGFFLFADWNNDFRLTSPRVYQTSGGTTTKLFDVDEFNYNPRMKTSGNWTALHYQGRILRKKIDSAGMDSVAYPTVVEYPHTKDMGLSDHGDIVLSRDDSLFRLAGGIPQFQYRTSKGNIDQIAVEGNLAIFMANAAEGRSLVRYDGNEEQVLVPPATNNYFVAGTDFQLRNGWVAFYRPGNLGQRHIWLMDPQGKERQITLFGTSSTLGHLAGNGELTFINGDKKYLSDSAGRAVVFSENMGTERWEDRQWYFLLGNTLFRLDAQPPTGLAGKAVSTPSRPVTGYVLVLQAGGPSWLRLAVPRAGFHEVHLNDLGGRRVAKVYAGRLQQGWNNLAIDTRGLRGGYYPFSVRKIADR